MHPAASVHVYDQGVIAIVSGYVDVYYLQGIPVTVRDALVGMRVLSRINGFKLRFHIHLLVGQFAYRSAD